MEKRFRTFTVLITKVYREIKKIKAGEMASMDLKISHVSCIYYLYKYSSLTAKELCDICGEDKASISRSMDFLEENGYIKCLDNVKKRYKSPLILTDKGTKAGREIDKKIEGILDEASKDLSEEHRNIFYNSLDIISKNLERICSKY